MQIVAAVAVEPKGDFKIETLTLDEPRPDEILVRVVACGICHTDIVFRDQVVPIQLPAVLGHEGSGVVERVGANVTRVAPGDHVVLTFRCCGNCARCRAGEPSYCHEMGSLNSSGARTDGTQAIHRGGDPISSNFLGQSSFASHALAYEDNVVVVDKDLPLQLLGPLGCGVQTGAGAVLRALRCPAGSSLLVMGGGPVGLSAVMAAVVAGCSRILVSDPLASRRKLASQLGATAVADPQADNIAEFVRNLTGAGCDYVIDTTGIPAVMNQAMTCLRPNGTLGLLGVPSPQDTPTPGLAGQVLHYGLTVRGIIEGNSEPQVFIPELLALFRAGRFPFDKLIRTYPLAEINAATRDQHRGLCAKPVLLMEGADTRSNHLPI
jgi:aryl-alcohol dehydrogenase